MKLSVRKKVANGLVIFLVAPNAFVAASNLLETYANGLAGFAAEDNFDLTADQKSTATATVKVKQTAKTEDDPSGSDPSAYDPSGFDPDGYDPSGGDPSGCDPSGAPPTLVVKAPKQLITAEDGSADLFELSMPFDPPYPKTYYLASTKPWEAKPEPNVVTLFENACIPQSIWVIGQNDYIMDGDIYYQIEILDEQDSVVETVQGVNLDNENYPGIAVDVLGPTSLPKGGDGGMFLIRVANVSGAEVSKSTLQIEPTDHLKIMNYATALLSGDAFKVKGKLDKSGALVFKNVALQASDMLTVSLEAMLDEDSSEDQALTARFLNQGGREQSDDNQDIRTATP